MASDNKAHITVILDRSGSMASIASDVIGAVNKFIDEQKAVPGDCTFTLVQFDDKAPYEVIQNAVPMTEARHLSGETYIPRGNTPLLDAMGKGIVSLGETLAAMSEATRPSKVVFVVQTDGMENASKEYTRERIAEMVKHQSEVYKWQFVFLGANQDAIATGAGMAVGAASSMNFAASRAGVANTYRATSLNVRSFRMGTAPDVSYTAEQRSEAMSK